MRYQRYKDLSDKSSPQKYYLKQEPGSSKTATIASIAKEIEITGALSAEDVTHVMQAFVRQLKKSLVEGNKGRARYVLHHADFRRNGNGKRVYRKGYQACAYPLCRGQQPATGKRQHGYHPRRREQCVVLHQE